MAYLPLNYKALLQTLTRLSETPAHPLMLKDVTNRKAELPHFSALGT